MKKVTCIGIVVLSAIVVLISSNAMAGGGVDWKLSLTNNTDYPIKAKVYREGKEYSEPWVTVAKGATHTFKCGALCPGLLMGQMYIGNKWVLIKSKSVGVNRDICKGEPLYESSAACWNSMWKVRRVAGQGYTEVRDCDYAFDKY